MSKDYRITLTNLAVADTDITQAENGTTPPLEAPINGPWKLEYSIRGDYKMYHFWSRGEHDLYDGAETYWTGRADNASTGEIGTGDYLKINVTSTDTTVVKDVYLNTDVPTWLTGGEAVWWDADGYITVSIVGKGTATQQAVNLDLVVEGDYIYFSATGPGTGTDGFAEQPTLFENHTGTGGWNYDIDNGLTPSLDRSGKYDIRTIEKEESRFINGIHIHGTNSVYKEFHHNREGWKIPPGYFIRLTAENPNAATWHLDFMLNLVRERTV